MQLAEEAAINLDGIEFTLLERENCEEILPALRFSKDKDHACVGYYVHQVHGWSLSIATLGQKFAGLYSLGGFRIVPEERASREGFDPRREALELALGMEKKISWSREVRVAGPRGLPKLDKIVGGKCVLLPTPGARVGEINDIQCLQFATECLEHFRQTTGIELITGQDLGHGLLSDGVTQSLDYLNQHFMGSITADTSDPTAEGNIFALRGALAAYGISMKRARIGFFGCGHIGMRVLKRAIEHEATLLTCVELLPTTRQAIEVLGFEAWTPDRKAEFFASPLDAIVVNANGGTLDSETVAIAAQNPELKIICGCENLVMANPADTKVLRQAEKIFLPTEYCGMMGYLTAVEEFLTVAANKQFDIGVMRQAARRLEPVTFEAVSYILRNNHALPFNEAVSAVSEVI